MPRHMQVMVLASAHRGSQETQCAMLAHATQAGSARRVPLLWLPPIQVVHKHDAVVALQQPVAPPLRQG